jgi:hypothetical protein
MGLQPEDGATAAGESPSQGIDIGCLRLECRAKLSIRHKPALVLVDTCSVHAAHAGMTQHCVDRDIW